jgi:enamine deaminase RidA (YjgF/YER057c/UK114 family)
MVWSTARDRLAKIPRLAKWLRARSKIERYDTHQSLSLDHDRISSLHVSGSWLINLNQRQILQNLSAVLAAGGSSIENAVKVNIFLTSMDNYKAMNEVYAQYFPDPKPVSLANLLIAFTVFRTSTNARKVRTCVCVKELPLGTDVEIECSGFVA